MTSCHVCERCGGKGETWNGAERKPCWYCDGTGMLQPGPRKTGRPPR